MESHSIIFSLGNFQHLLWNGNIYKGKRLKLLKKITKTWSTSYTTSSDACVELDLNDNDKHKLEEIAHLMDMDKAKSKGSSSNDAYALIMI